MRLLETLVKEASEEIGVVDPAMQGLRKGRVIRDRIAEVEPTEPPPGEIEMHVLATPPLRSDTPAAADDQHPDRGDPPTACPSSR
ncbi:MAG: hypothetical protein AAF565_18950 [Pseudomonadota bacterium]